MPFSFFKKTPAEITSAQKSLNAYVNTELQEKSPLDTLKGKVISGVNWAVNLGFGVWSGYGIYESYFKNPKIIQTFIDDCYQYISSTETNYCSALTSTLKGYNTAEKVNATMMTVFVGIGILFTAGATYAQIKQHYNAKSEILNQNISSLTPAAYSKIIDANSKYNLEIREYSSLKDIHKTLNNYQDKPTSAYIRNNLYTPPQPKPANEGKDQIERLRNVI